MRTGTLALPRVRISPSMPVVWSKWPWLSTTTSTSCSRRRMFSISPSGEDAGVKQHPVFPTALGDRHQGGEAVLGAQRVERLAALDQSGARAAALGSRS